MKKPGQAVSSLSQLPDGVLLNILGRIPLQHRLSTVPLVSRQLRRLCTAPELLHKLSIRARHINSAAKAQALASWLSQYGSHLRSLTLAIGTDEARDHPDGAAVMRTISSSCLTVAAAGAGQLADVAVSVPWVHAEWLPLAEMHSVRSLVLQTTGGQTLQQAAGLSNLTRLQYLRLSGKRLTLSATLPTSLTRLDIDSSSTCMMASLPVEWHKCTSLVRVSLSEVNTSDWHGISTLTNLTNLLINAVHGRHPPGISALTALRRLQLIELPRGWHEDGLNVMLRPLGRLTALTLWAEHLGTVPTALGQLSQLRVCEMMLLSRDDDTSRENPQGRKLPAGPWLDSLRAVCVDWATLDNSCDILSHASRLEYICPTGMPERLRGGPGSSTLLNWAARHPPLRRLGLVNGGGHGMPIWSDVFSELMDVKTRRPELDIFQAGHWGHDDFWSNAAGG